MGRGVDGGPDVDGVGQPVQVDSVGDAPGQGKVAVGLSFVSRDGAEVHAIQDINLDVHRDEFVSIVGPSGSGKSTLFYVLGGLTRADRGRVIIDGEDFSRLSDAERTRMRRRKIGFVFQKFNLLPTLDARGNIYIAHDIAGGNGEFDTA